MSRKRAREEQEDVVQQEALLYDNPLIADDEETRVKNAVEYHAGERKWSKTKSAQKAGISISKLKRYVYFQLLHFSSIYNDLTLILFHLIVIIVNSVAKPMFDREERKAAKSFKNCCYCVS